MSTAVVKPSKWRNRVWRLTIASTLKGILVAIGAAIMGYIAIRVLAGMVMAMIWMASASGQATTNALYFGDSETRLTVLTQLQQTFETQTTIAFDQQTSAWILPAIEHCKKDVDLEVVLLAEQLAVYVKDNTQPPSQ